MPAHNPRRMLYRGEAPESGVQMFADMWLHVERSDGWHHHSGDQVLAVLDGALAMGVGEQMLTVTTGEALRIPAGTPHHVVRSAQAQAARLLNLRLLEGQTPLSREVAQLPQRPLPVEMVEMQGLSQSLLAVDASTQSNPIPTLLAGVWRLVAMVARADGDHRLRADLRSMDPRLATCEALIHQMLDQADLDAALLANRVGLSRSQLDRLYRQRFDQTPADRIRAARLDRARRLLTASGYSVKQIAAVCGFGQSVNLTRAFRSHEGCTPTQYREASVGQGDAGR